MLPNKLPSLTPEEQKWLETLYRENYTQMRSLASLLFTKNGLPDAARTLSHDAVQEVFILAIRKWAQVAKAEDPVKWLYAALHFKILNMVKNEWYKKERSSDKEAEDILDPTDFYNAADLRMTLQSSITPEEYQLLGQLYLAGYSYEEMSDRLQMKKSTFAMKVSRLKQKIKEIIK